MERRKVQITGGSTFIVSLPKKWVDRQGIKPGEPVDVHYEPDGPVTIYPIGSPNAPARSIEIDVLVDDHPMHTVRGVISAYLAGFEAIRIRAERRIPAEHKQAIRKLAQTLIGIEIVEETAAEIVLQDLIDPKDFDMTKALGRMHQITRAMVGDVLTAFETHDVELAEDVSLRDSDVDRLDWMIKKQFHLIAGSARLAGALALTASQAHHHLLISHALERVADHATRLAEIVGDANSRAITADARAGAVAYGRKMLGLLDDAMTAFHGLDARGGNLAIERCKESKREVRGLLETTKGKAAAQVDFALVVESLERIRNYTMDVAEVAIDHVILIGGRASGQGNGQRRHA